jgi:segregation and condensation protein A
MEASVDPDGESDAGPVGERPPTERMRGPVASTAFVSVDGGWVADGLGEREGEGASPVLTLDGFNGPLDQLLTLARAQQIDLLRISLTTLVAQLADALRQAAGKIPLGQQADWVVMAAWLVQLRTRLLLPADAPAQKEAAAEAEQLRTRLSALQAMRALAGWLEQRPQLGHDVFARGRPPSRAQSPEIFGNSVEAGSAIDVVEFLWASLALFDDETAAADTATVYRARPFALYAVAEARDRILRRLDDAPDGARLDQLLPDLAALAEPHAAVRRRSAWSSTFIASLELARQGEVVLGQEQDFQTIHVALVTSLPSDLPSDSVSSGKD